jgi:hypothetical protein
MHTLLVRMSVDPSRASEVERHLRDDVATWSKQLPGFVSGQWLLNADQASGFGVVVFSSEDAALTAAAGPRGLRRDESRAWNIVDVSVYEQVASA